jgi:hypothetical protein
MDEASGWGGVISEWTNSEMTSHGILADGASHNSPLGTKDRVLRSDDVLSCTEPPLSSLTQRQNLMEATSQR